MGDTQTLNPRRGTHLRITGVFMTEEIPEPQLSETTDPVEAPVEAAENQSNQQVEAQDVSTEDHEKTVPLSAHIKQRKKLQQAQEEIEYYKKREAQQPQTEAEEDYSKYESVTRDELGKYQFETIRAVREGDWAETHPERMAIVEAELEDFLKQRPNLGPAINSAPNRYKEAWELMQALSPRKTVAKQAPAKQAPGSPGSVPKAAALNEAIDLMSMSDSEYQQWAKSKRKRR